MGFRGTVLGQTPAAEYEAARRDQEGVVRAFDGISAFMGEDKALEAVAQASESLQDAAVAYSEAGA